jgi:hypothetical protein
MARRGEVPFVAIRVGRSNDPRETLSIARELKCSRATALGYVALWEELILEVGDAVSGRLPKGYSATHVAAKLDFDGPPRRIVEVLKSAGLLAQQRTTLLHPYWRQSVTGQYAKDRADQREYWRGLKAKQRAEHGRPGDVPGTSPGIPETSHETADIKAERNGITGASPPPSPPPGGGLAGASRWDWLRQHHRRPMNPRGCMVYLAALSPDEWALVQWLTALPPGGGPYKLSRKKRVLELDTHALLSKQAFLQLLPEWREKLRRDQQPERRAVPRVAPVDDGAELERRRASAVAFVLAQLGDAELSEAAKEKARARFIAAHPDIPPPWDAPAGPLSDAGVTH